MSDFLCEELIFEIFTRLPVKSLLRFRSLSKSLRSCIGSPSFIRKHTLRSRQKLLIKHQIRLKVPLVYTLHSEDQLPLCPRRGYTGITTLEFPPGYYHIIGSCNGILCLWDLGYGISLWNPSIRCTLAVPGRPRRYLYSLYVGFGFDRIADDYKIITLTNTRNSENGISLIYAMKTGTWCEIDSPIPFFTRATSWACFINGSLHWVVGNFNKSNDNVYILTFDLSTHAFGMIALPEPTNYATQVTTLQGSLAVVYYNLVDIWMWVMKEYNNTASWSLVFKSKRDLVKQGVLHKDLQQTNYDDFFFNTLSGGCQLWNTKIGMRSKLVNLNSNYEIDDMKLFVESLQLLDIDIVAKARQEKVEAVDK